MRVEVPASTAELARPSTWRMRPSPFVIDIGANIGCGGKHVGRMRARWLCVRMPWSQALQQPTRQIV